MEIRVESQSKEHPLGVTKLEDGGWIFRYLPEPNVRKKIPGLVIDMLTEHRMYVREHTVPKYPCEKFTLSELLTGEGHGAISESGAAILRLLKDERIDYVADKLNPDGLDDERFSDFIVGIVGLVDQGFLRNPRTRKELIDDMKRAQQLANELADIVQKWKHSDFGLSLELFYISNMVSHIFKIKKAFASVIAPLTPSGNFDVEFMKSDNIHLALRMMADMFGQAKQAKFRRHGFDREKKTHHQKAARDTFQKHLGELLIEQYGQPHYEVNVTITGIMFDLPDDALSPYSTCKKVKGVASSS